MAASREAAQSLGRRTAGATVGVALSRVSGIARSQVVNAVFGAGLALDAYNVAMRFPTVLRDLFAEGALSAAFTKGLVQARAHSPEAERALTSLVVGIFGIITLVVSLVGALCAEPFVRSVTSASFEAGGGAELAASCFRVLIFYLPVAMLSAVAMALLGARGQTFRATIASLFFNVGSIAGALVGAPLFAAAGGDAILGLAFGTLAGGALQFLYQVVPLMREGAISMPRLRWSVFPGLFQRHPALDILLLMLPRMLGQGALSIALFINTHFATAAGIGAITYITNAQNIILVPVGLFGVASGFASLPLLTEAVVAKDEQRLSALLRSSARSTLWLASASVVSLALLAVPLCKALLEHGRVTSQDSLMNGLAVSAYCLSILFNSLNKVLTQGYYALGDTRQIIVNNVCYLVLNGTLSALLAPRYGILGLGLSNCASAGLDLILNLGFLSAVARRLGFSLFTWARERRFYNELIVHTVVCVGAVAVAVFLLNPFFERLTVSQAVPFTAWTALLMACAGGSLIGMVWAAAVYAWGPEELQALFRRVLRKVRR